ncbi:HigA family addiction module antidote protein [Ochrobactrum cytisi]|nr:HigA family addiction module antidote protein [Brucella cytisi]
MIAGRKPVTVGGVLTEVFMEPMGLTQGALAEATGVQRKHIKELRGNRQNLTAATVPILARVFGNSLDFWLNLQRRIDLWEVMNTPGKRERIEQARPEYLKPGFSIQDIIRIRWMPFPEYDWTKPVSKPGWNMHDVSV